MTAHPRILIVDDDPIVAESLADFLTGEGFVTATAGDGNEALAMLETANRPVDDRSGGNGDNGQTVAAPFGVVITDLAMPRCNGMELLRRLRKDQRSVVPIVVTGFGKIESAVEAVKLGAVDYLTKPVVDDELRIAVNKALRQHALLAENQTLRSQLDQRFGMGSIVGHDYRMQKVYDLVEAVAASKTTVLVEGESGTGKSMVARAIHTRSSRSAGPFITFSCGAIPETLLERELFGNVKGAFTGAEFDKPGKLQAADAGTLFIDEINSATPALQLKLLRVLQEKQFEPVGSTQTISVDVRFVLATNESLVELVAAGRFRQDLYYRINVVNIGLPALRQRVGDIQVLAEHFLIKYCNEVGRQVTGFTDEAQAALHRYPWPGNVRELENAVERAVVLCRRPVIDVDDLPETVSCQRPAGLNGAGVNGAAGAGAVGRTNGAPVEAVIPALQGGWTPTPLNEAMLAPERQILLAALKANEWNRQETARQLGINRTTLYKKIKQFKLDEPG